MSAARSTMDRELEQLRGAALVADQTGLLVASAIAGRRPVGQALEERDLLGDALGRLLVATAILLGVAAAQLLGAR